LKGLFACYVELSKSSFQGEGRSARKSPIGEG